jgi:hypothetical protein
MGKLGSIFGFDRRKLWWYRDIALITVAAIMTLWIIVAITGTTSVFNRRVATGAAAIAFLCFLLTPNRLLLFAGVLGIVALQGCFAVVFSGDRRSWLIAVPATFLEVGLLWKYRNRPLQK